MGKGQVSMEFLLIMGIAFVMLIPTLILFLTQSQDMQEDVTSVQLNKLAEELVLASDTVYYLGEPSKKTIKVYMPKFVESINFTMNRMLFNVDSGHLKYTLLKVTAANITGNLSSEPGVHIIEIVSEGDTVRITG
ncbi:MAG: hypothetical protein ABIC91_00105 [Nanoarchaeota archaeon]|nr:hypothetical protein [Nanoarchaeota archaeon]MBU1029615.1 hypothetical protein [Nanoarchaeota archaeon]MBU1850232.1 hypothetical protein [Nanoarchaeota archaeon]